MKLVIFDLDQTLVDLIDIHNRATRDLFRSEFGVDAHLTEIDFAGRSLIDNFSELARKKGLPESVIRTRCREVLDKYGTVFARNIPPDVSHYILPGARELLEALAETKSMAVLYTGNSPGITSTVLRVTGLHRFFSFTLSGTEIKIRADMVKHAIDTAGKMTGVEFRGKDVVVVGDSVRDIECGKQFNALTIAVATGFHTPERLAEKQPDYIFASLADHRKVLEAILQ